MHWFVASCSMQHAGLTFPTSPPCVLKTYVVIKHLGTGTFGQVKLAFSLKDKKLYAIKSCKKSRMGLPGSSSRPGGSGGSRWGHPEGPHTMT